MRSGANTEPVAVAPVAQVVPATLAGTGPVRDLVVPVAVLPQDPFGELVQPYDTGIVWLRGRRALPPALHRTPAGARPVRDRLLGLQGQLQRVAGEVVGRRATSGGSSRLGVPPPT